LAESDFSPYGLEDWLSGNESEPSGEIDKSSSEFFIEDESEGIDQFWSDCQVSSRDGLSDENSSGFQVFVQEVENGPGVVLGSGVGVEVEFCGSEYSGQKGVHDWLQLRLSQVQVGVYLSRFEVCFP
jgi:hypothetical protein